MGQLLFQLSLSVMGSIMRWHDTIDYMSSTVSTDKNVLCESTHSPCYDGHPTASVVLRQICPQDQSKLGRVVDSDLETCLVRASGTFGRRNNRNSDSPE